MKAGTEAAVEWFPPPRRFGCLVAPSHGSQPSGSLVFVAFSFSCGGFPTDPLKVKVFAGDLRTAQVGEKAKRFSVTPRRVRTFSANTLSFRFCGPKGPALEPEISRFIPSAHFRSFRAAFCLFCDHLKRQTTSSWGCFGHSNRHKKFMGLLWPPQSEVRNPATQTNPRRRTSRRFSFQAPS